MSDALARNTPADHPTQAANCIPHGRRKFVEVYEAFPEEVAFVLETLRPVFLTDRQAKQDGLSPEARLLLHQQQSAPRMQALRDWMTKQIEDHLVEPNCGLGQAIVEAILREDFPVVLAIVMIVTAAFVIINILIDILYSLIDPRVRAS